MYTMKRLKNLEIAIEDAMEKCEIALDEIRQIRSEQRVNEIMSNFNKALFKSANASEGDGK